jgi:hypothetical protein
MQGLPSAIHAVETRYDETLQRFCGSLRGQSKGKDGGLQLEKDPKD